MAQLTGGAVAKERIDIAAHRYVPLESCTLGGSMRSSGWTCVRPLDNIAPNSAPHRHALQHRGGGGVPSFRRDLAREIDIIER
jgi:hypothetical protein